MNVNWGLIKQFFGFGREKLSDSEQELFLMQRRGFLKAIGAIGVSVAVPPALWLPEKKPVTMSPSDTQLLNEAIFEKLCSRDPVMEKEAMDAVNDFTRVKMREDGFFRRILPPVPISNDELDQVAHPNKVYVSKSTILPPIITSEPLLAGGVKPGDKINFSAGIDFGASVGDFSAVVTAVDGNRIEFIVDEEQKNEATRLLEGRDSLPVSMACNSLASRNRKIGKLRRRAAPVV